MNYISSFSSLFKKKPSNKPSKRRNDNAIPPVNFAHPYSSFGSFARVEIPADTDFDAQVKLMSGWVYVCATKNSASVASTPMRLYVVRKSASDKLLARTVRVPEKRKEYIVKNASFAVQQKISRTFDFEEVVEHPFLTLLRKVNPYMNAFDLWDLSEQFLELTGNCFWYVNRENPLNIPTEIWVLPTQNMKIVPGTDRFIKGYVYTNGFEKIPFDANEVIHFKFMSVRNVYYGLSPLQGGIVSVLLYNDMMAFENSLMKNNARPEGVLTTDQALSDREFQRLKDDWKENYSGSTKVGKTILLEKNLKYEKISWNPRELVLNQGRILTREEILAAFGVPISKVTSENVNLANADVGEIQYQRDTIVPRLKRLEEKLNEQMIESYDPNLFVAFDNPVPENKLMQIRERESNLKTFFSSVNEERALVGRLPVPWGDEPISITSGKPISEDSPDDEKKPENPKKPPKEEEDDEEEDDKAFIEEVAKSSFEKFKSFIDSH